MHILVVDDDPVVLNSCKRILESDGQEISLASNVKEGMDIISERQIDLILVDIKMPEEDGLSLIRKVKEKDISIPILVMSGYPTSETIDTSITGGAAAFIPKPFTPDELLNTIKNIVKGESNGQKEDSGH
jgi:DNA-binding NtrC family response regulator